MKKYIPLAFLMILALLLSGCAKKNSVAKMTIAPAESIEDTLELLDIPDENVEFFDFAVDKTIKSASIDIWHYENGEWVSVLQNVGNLKSSEGRIGVRMNSEGYDIFLLEDGYRDAVNLPSVESFDSALAVFGIRLSQTTTIADGHEIELWSKVGIDSSSSDMLPAFSSFRTSDCDSGVAVTITFSSESVE